MRVRERASASSHISKDATEDSKRTEDKSTFGQDEVVAFGPPLFRTPHTIYGPHIQSIMRFMNVHVFIFDVKIVLRLICMKH